MRNLASGAVRRVCDAAAVAAFSLLIGYGAHAQVGTTKAPSPRIQGDIENSQRMVVPGTHSPLARAEFEVGRVPASTKLEGMTIVLGRSTAQEADLQTLLAAQQDPNSPQYHKWLTADEFAARFGVADADAAKVEFWLQQQGFALQGRSRSNDRIQFSGTVQQVESTFGTEMHYYQVAGTKHFAPSTDLSVPVAMGPMVQTVTNLSSFRPQAHIKHPTTAEAVRPDFTSSQTQNHFLTPKDVATIYDVTPAYSAGLTGTGQSIAVVGQSSIVVTDIENFQSAAGLPKKDPTIVQVPNSGTAAISTGDESESDLDLEYSGGMAPGATIIFVFVGNNKNFGVFDALTFAIQNRTAPIISISYGTCESDLGTGEYSALNGTLARAAAQGQSVITADGDNGSEDCSGNTNQSTAQQQALAVDFPSSSQWVTGMGGTEFPTADVVSTNTTFWTAANGSDVISSAKSYIPEMVWNDDIAATATVPGTLSSGGGGVSTLTPRPSWQTGVPGIPSGNFRFVPDISLTASPNNAGFLYCSSDTTDTKITGSCTPANGFRDSSNTNLTVAGGTSFDAPIFAGMVAIINQKTNSSGQGLVNPTLYMLASNAATYASAFHDITAGSNKCTAGTALCSTAGAGSFSATTGYDEASGLGSVDFFNLLSAWPGSTATSVASTTTLSAATLTPASGASDVITIMVASGSSASTVTPTGTLTVAVDGTTQTSTLALANGAAAFTFTSATTGAHTISATYSGDGTYASSTGTLSVTVGGASAKSFSLTASNATVAAGGSGTSTITVTPQNGYTGTIAFTVTSSPAVANACFSVPNVTVSGATAVTAMMTVKTSSALCGTGAMIGAVGADRSRDGRWANVFGWWVGDSGRLNLVAVSGLALSCVFLVGLFGLRSRRWGLIWAALVLVALVAGISGCGGGGSASSTSANGSVNAAKGTYTLTVTGMDSVTASVKASGTLTLTID